MYQLGMRVTVPSEQGLLLDFSRIFSNWNERRKPMCANVHIQRTVRFQQAGRGSGHRKWRQSACPD